MLMNHRARPPIPCRNLRSLKERLSELQASSAKTWRPTGGYAGLRDPVAKWGKVRRASTFRLFGTALAGLFRHGSGQGVR